MQGCTTNYARKQCCWELLAAGLPEADLQHLIDQKILPMMRDLRKTVMAVIFAAAISIFVPALAHADTAKRLILKDGSYQSVVKYEIKGDRVRYLSAERYEWEELPKDMVDWPATEKWEKDRAAGNAEVKAASEDMEAIRKEEEARSPLVAPGLNLPPQGGVYLLDDYRGQKQLDELVQNGAEINKNMGRNVLRAAINPIASSKQSIELKGARARVQAHEGTPVIYLSVDTDSDSNARTDAPALTKRFRVVRAERKKDNRVVGNLKIALTGSVKQEQAFVETNVTEMPGGWLKIVPTQPLAPGEYAMVEMLSPREINLYVWDFGVDPNAPENPSAWKPTPVSTETGTKQTPVLQQSRPR